MERSWEWADKPLSLVISDYLDTRPLHRHSKLIAVLSALSLLLGAQTLLVPKIMATQIDWVVGQTDGDPAIPPTTSTPTTSTPTTSTPTTSTPTRSESVIEGGVSRIAVKYRTPSRSGFVVNAVESESGVPMSGDAPNAGSVQVLKFPTPISKSEAEDLVAAFESRPDVLWAELPTTMYPNVYPTSPPNDPLYGSEQWPLWGPYGIGIGSGNSAMANSWSVATGEPVVVAVLDTGYVQHVDFPASQMVAGYDFVSADTVGLRNRAYGGGTSTASVNMDGDYIDTNTYGPVGPDAIPLDPGDWNSRNSVWHGTFIAGLIAAATNNGVAIAGAAPSARVQPVRVASWRGADSFDIADGIEWASGGSTFFGVATPPPNATPAKVINVSLGATEVGACTFDIAGAIERAIARGSIVVVSAGNNSAEASLRAPSNCPGVISVAATGPNGKLADYSNYGSVSLAGPGGSIPASGSGILSLFNPGTTTPTTVGTQTAFGTGTSYSAPHVGAVAALLWSLDPTLTTSEVTSLLTTSAAPFPGGGCDPDTPVVKTCGSGIVSVSSAIATLIPSVSLLNSMSLSSGSLNPSFGRTTYGYSVAVDNAVSSIRVTAAGQPGAALTVNGASSTSGVASSPVALSVGANLIPVVVTSADLTSTSTYTIQVTRAASGGGGGGGGGGAPPDSGGGESPAPEVSTAPVISGISPGSGSILGGTRVTISGGNLTGASGVSFGGVPATNLVVVNASTIQVTTPRGVEGRRDVVVNTPRGSVTAVGGFYYLADAEPVRFTVASTKGGMERVIVSSGAAQSSPTVSLRGAKSGSQSTAPTLRTEINIVLAPQVRGLPKSKRWAVRMLVPGADNGTQRLFLGSVYSSKDGTSVLPAVRATKKGLFTYRLRAKEERTYYLNIQVP